MIRNLDIGCLVEITVSEVVALNESPTLNGATVLKDGSSVNTYSTRVTNSSEINEKKVSIATPKHYGEYVNIEVGSICNFLFFQKNDMIECQGVIEEILPDNELLIKTKGIVRYFQRRSHNRITVVIPFDFTIIDMLGEEIDKAKVIHGVVKDISGGGMRFVTNIKLPNLSRIQTKISLDDDYIEPIAEILSNKKFPRSNYKYQYRVRFIEPPPMVKNKVNKFIDNSIGLQ